MRRGLQPASILILSLIGTGCRFGEIGPMPTRLDDEEQRHVNDAWQNALSPANRLDRDLLLDVMLNSAMYWHGVDRIHATAEKDLIGGRVVMELSFDRSQPPESDSFSVTVVDANNQTMRVEQFSRAEIDARLESLYPRQLIRIGDSENIAEEEKAALQAEEERIDQRQLQIIAATQPAE